MAEPTKVTIYAIQHVPTGRIYVGRTKDLEQRLKAHLSALKSNTHSNELMQSDYNEHGDDYDFFILEVVEMHYPKVRDAEFEWMERLNTGDKRVGYNYKDPHFKKAGYALEISPGIPIPNEVD